MLPMALKLACKIYQLSICSLDAQPLILEELNVVVRLSMVNLTPPTLKSEKHLHVTSPVQHHPQITHKGHERLKKLSTVKLILQFLKKYEENSMENFHTDVRA